MFVHNGITYLTEEEWSDSKVRAKYPDAMLAQNYRKYHPLPGGRALETEFVNGGANRKMRRDMVRKLKRGAKQYTVGTEA